MRLLYLGVIVIFVIITFPLMMGIGLCIAICDGLPIFFYQRRVGKHAAPFTMVKFRTMVREAEQQKERLLKYNEADGPVFKIRNDPRYTTLGKFLAHTGLDELPQLWNVLRGEMALIGPRPLPVEEANKLSQAQCVRNAVLPGIISPWILDGYHSQTFDTWMKSDLAYIKAKSIPHDMSLFVNSVRFMVMLFVRELGHMLLNNRA